MLESSYLRETQTSLSPDEKQLEVYSAINKNTSPKKKKKGFKSYVASVSNCQSTGNTVKRKYIKM